MTLKHDIDNDFKFDHSRYFKDTILSIVMLLISFKSNRLLSIVITDLRSKGVGNVIQKAIEDITEFWFDVNDLEYSESCVFEAMKDLFRILHTVKLRCYILNKIKS